MFYYFYEFIQTTYRPRTRAQATAQAAANNNDVNQVTSQLQSLAVDNGSDSEIEAVDNDSETETVVDSDSEIEDVDNYQNYICDSEMEVVRKSIYDKAIVSTRQPIFYNLTGDSIAMRDFDPNTYLKILKRHDDWVILRKMQQSSYICQCHDLSDTKYECIYEMIWKSLQNLLILNSALHLPETIDRDLFKVFDTKTYQAYLFLESTGIAHTVCHKMKKVICKSCSHKELCEGVKKKASLKASQEAELEGSTQQIEEAENADKQKLSDDLIKPNYHINIPFDLIGKKKSHDLLDSGFYYTVQHLIPPYKKGEKCKCKYSNKYSDADPIEKQWYKKIPLLTPTHVWYVSICFHPTKGKCKCKKIYTGEEHLLVIYKDTQLFTVKCLMDLLTEIQYNKVSMFGMTCASNLSSNILTDAKSVNPDILRIALYKFINMLKFDKKKTWDCIYCKHAPKLV